MRECTEHEITIEKLMNIVHNYTDPIRIEVIMADAWMTCEEAKHMRDFVLTERYSYRDREEQERLLKYYKDVPVWKMNQCDICEEMGCKDCMNCYLGNPCLGCEDYDKRCEKK